MRYRDKIKLFLLFAVELTIYIYITSFNLFYFPLSSPDFSFLLLSHLYGVVLCLVYIRDTVLKEP